MNTVINNLKWLIPSMRPKQWNKNLIIFTGLVFTGRFFNLFCLIKSVLAVLIFCVATGAMYIFNDLVDKSKDEFHPFKKQKIMFAQNVSSNRIEFALGVLAMGALFAAFLLNTFFGLAVLVYFVVAILYSYFLREIALLDILTLSGMLALIAASGFVVLNEMPSSWVILTSFFLGLVLITLERQHELSVLGQNALLHRKVFEVYTQEFLGQLLILFSSSTILLYSLSCLLGDETIRLRASGLICTIPLVVFGLIRLIMLAKSNEALSKSTEELLLDDHPLLICAGIWIFLLLLVVYIFPR